MVYPVQVFLEHLIPNRLLLRGMPALFFILREARNMAGTMASPRSTCPCGSSEFDERRVSIQLTNRSVDQPDALMVERMPPMLSSYIVGKTLGLGGFAA